MNATGSVALVVALAAACGTAPDLATAGADGDAIDADEGPVQELQPAVLSLSRGAPVSGTPVTADVDGGKGDVLVGSFLMGCGIGLQHGPFAATVVDDAFAVVVPDTIDNMMLVAAFVDVDGDGEFDADGDLVLSAGGYDGLDVDGDGVVALHVVAEDDWLRDIVPALLLQATTTVE